LERTVGHCWRSPRLASVGGIQLNACRYESLCRPCGTETSCLPDSCHWTTLGSALAPLTISWITVSHPACPTPRTSKKLSSTMNAPRSWRNMRPTPNCAMPMAVRARQMHRNPAPAMSRPRTQAAQACSTMPRTVRPRRRVALTRGQTKPGRLSFCTLARRGTAMCAQGEKVQQDLLNRLLPSLFLPRFDCCSIAITALLAGVLILAYRRPGCRS